METNNYNGSGYSGGDYNSDNYNGRNDGIQQNRQPEYGAYAPTDEGNNTYNNNYSTNHHEPVHQNYSAANYNGAPQATATWNQSFATQTRAMFQEKSRVTIGRSYGEMAIGLAITAVVAYFMQTSGLIINLLISTNGYIMWGLFIAQIAIVIWLSTRIMSMSKTTARIAFYSYAALTGITFSTLFLVYSLGSILQVFLLCAAFFGALTMLSLTTKIDMLKAGPILFVALIALIIGQILAVFLSPGNTTMMIISALGVILFAGLTMYDAQKTRTLLATYANQPEVLPQLSIYCAFSLYLDFINMFLYLLRLLGSRR